MWCEADVRVSSTSLITHLLLNTNITKLFNGPKRRAVNWLWHMLPDQNSILMLLNTKLITILPTARQESHICFKLHIHPKSSKLFIKFVVWEHRRTFSEEQTQCVTKLQMSSNFKNRKCEIGPDSVTFPVFWKACLHDLKQLWEAIVFFPRDSWSTSQ